MWTTWTVAERDTSELSGAVEIALTRAAKAVKVVADQERNDSRMMKSKRRK